MCTVQYISSTSHATNYWIHATAPHNNSRQLQHVKGIKFYKYWTSREIGNTQKQKTTTKHQYKQTLTGAAIPRCISIANERYEIWTYSMERINLHTLLLTLSHLSTVDIFMLVPYSPPQSKSNVYLNLIIKNRAQLNKLLEKYLRF